ncbi:HEPN domain-containing protein [Phenylobacterium aquaticum]|uniref:HEPN domain-containing protein n=1 Tax=Phenylobacterium aquaticum TaxID=1763816 RepID=UPI0026EDDC34|nr:HEPN domain-containing protein [Phenylobacterium aquaticum]
MDTTKAFESFENKLKDLEETIRECDKIIISDEPIKFVYDNANFLTKSFLINLCGYLETYIKDALESLLFDFNMRIKNENLPYNLIRWNIEQKSSSDSKMSSILEKKHCRNEILDLKIKKKDLDSFISGNPFRTKDLFLMFGIDLEKNNDFIKYKEIVNTIVTKRNNILHHNDNASDIGNSDILIYLVEIKQYANALDIEIKMRITTASNS